MELGGVARQQQVCGTGVVWRPSAPWAWPPLLGSLSWLPKAVATKRLA